MRALKIFTVLCCAALVIATTACSDQGDSTPYFQNNVGTTDPTGGGGTNPFDGLPDIGDPAVFENPVALIAEAFNPGTFNLTVTGTDYMAFADRMETLRTTPALQPAIDEVLYKMDDIANDATYAASGRGIYGLMAALRNIMGYIITQDSYDNGGYSAGSGDMTDDLYAFLLKIDEADLGIKDDALTTGFKVLNYLNATYDDTTTNTIMTDLISFLTDSTGQTFPSLVIQLQEGLGKQLAQADTEITYNDPKDWDGTGDHNIELGNAVKGMDYLMQGLSDMVVNDSAAEQDLYDIIRQLGVLMGQKSGGNFVFKTKIKQLLMDIEDYFTTGGGQVTASYSNASNPYVNAELRNAVKDLWPGLVKLMIRQRAGGATHPDYSIINNTTDATRSPVEWLTIALQQLKSNGIDYSVAGNELEPSLRRMVQYNGLGQDRSSATYKVPMLNHMVATIAGGFNFGYLTRVVAGGGASGEPYNNQPSSGIGTSYQHGKSTGGILTFNDSMYAVTSFGINTVGEDPIFGSEVLNAWNDTYSLVLSQRTSAGQYTWRSGTSFAYNDANKANYQFYMGYDYPNLLLLPPSCAGDAGIPGGGQKAITPTQNTTTVSTASSVSVNDYRTYFPKVADGIGNINTGSFIFSWIARACWDGAGPYYYAAAKDSDPGTNDPTTTFNWPGIGNRTVTVYYKPNGEVYAYVYKGTPWEYYYPATGNGNDVADADSSANGQRFNRYRDICRSDYYMVQKGRPHARTTACGLIEVSPANGTSFSVPPMNPSGSSYADVSGRGKYYLLDGNFTSQYFQLYEKFQEWSNGDVNGVIAYTEAGSTYPIMGNIARECASQEEAMYRNYQWLMLEKKFMFVVPVHMYADMICTGLADGVHAYLDGAAFLVIEANGIVGLTNAKKGTGNGVWVSRGIEGAGTNPAGHRNNPDYGDSLRPGDARILAWATYYNNSNAPSGGTVNPDVVFGLMGSGRVMAEAVGQNIGPVLRLGFVDQTGYIDSRFSTSSAVWTARNRILPIFVALAGTLKDGTYYNPGATAPNYNYAGRHKYPLDDLLEGVMVPLTKPLMRYYTDAESFTGGSSSTGRWVPRMQNETNGAFSYFTPSSASGWSDVTRYYTNSSLRTLTGLLAEHDPTTASLDGLLCMMADGPSNSFAGKTTLVTKLLSLLQRLGADDANYGDSGRAIRQNVAKGLEQMVTSMQVAEGEVRLTNGRSTRDNSRYGWIFGASTDNRRTGSVTPISVDLDNALNQLIGDNTMGLSKFVDDRLALYPTWQTASDNYARVFDMMGTIMGDSGSPYYITENVINIMDKFLGGVTPTSDDLKSLRHTLGTLMARYNSGWVPTTSAPANSELYQIVSVYLPDILRAYNRPPTNEFHYLLPVLIAFMDVDRNGTLEADEITGTDTSNLDYMTNLLIQGDTPEEIINSTYELMSRDAMWDPAYYTAGGYPNHATIKELADICEALADRP